MTNDSHSDRTADAETVDQTLATALDSLDGADNYINWIVDLMRPHARGPVLEVGAGHGTFTERLSTFGPVTSVEPDKHAFDLLASRFEDRRDITPVHGVLGDVPDDEPFGTAVMVNVLEHIEDDAGTLSDLHKRLDHQGTLLLWVPAFELLFSDFDVRLGHFRRYRRRQLTDRVAEAGFHVETCHYANLPGWFSWLLLVRLARWEPTGEAQVQFFDKRLVPLIRAAETKVRPPIGQSIFLAATKFG